MKNVFLKTVQQESSEYKTMSNKAAECERNGDYSAAATLWSRAHAFACLEANLKWAEARFSFCNTFGCQLRIG